MAKVKKSSLFATDEELGKRDDDHKPSATSQWVPKAVPSVMAWRAKRIFGGLLGLVAVYFFIVNMPNDLGPAQTRYSNRMGTAYAPPAGIRPFLGSEGPPNGQAHPPADTAARARADVRGSTPPPAEGGQSILDQTIHSFDGPVKFYHLASSLHAIARIQNLETACLPTTPDEERRRLLSFVVSGGGPTGVEFAAELFDMLNEDVCKYYPKLLRNEISVHVIQSRGHILNTYDEALSRYAEARFAHDQVDILTNSRVKEVQPDRIIFTQKDEEGKVVTKEIPMGFCLWSTGVSQAPICETLAKKLGDHQNNRHALITDSHLRLNGTPLGDVYCIGDASTVANNASDHIVSFLQTLAWEKGLDPKTMKISFSDWRQVAKRVRSRFPQAADQLKRLDKLFEQYDKDKSGTLDFSELHELLRQIDDKMTSLPATAQRANQQGMYLARKFNKLAQAQQGMTLNEVDYGDLDETVYKAFEYKHLGSLAYIGNSAVFDFGNGIGFSGGLLAVYLWRSIYFAQSVSLRTRVLLAMDWGKRALFGRDLMNF